MEARNAVISGPDFADQIEARDLRYAEPPAGAIVACSPISVTMPMITALPDSMPINFPTVGMFAAGHAGGELDGGLRTGNGRHAADFNSDAGRVGAWALCATEAFMITHGATCICISCGLSRLDWNTTGRWRFRCTKRPSADPTRIRIDRPRGGRFRSQATVELTARGGRGEHPTVGKFMGMLSGKAVIIGMVTDIGEQATMAQPAARPIAKIARLDLIGEIRSADDGVARFHRGVMEYPNIGDARCCHRGRACGWSLAAPTPTMPMSATCSRTPISACISTSTSW